MDYKRFLLLSGLSCLASCSSMNNFRKSENSGYCDVVLSKPYKPRTLFITESIEDSVYLEIGNLLPRNFPEFDFSKPYIKGFDLEGDGRIDFFLRLNVHEGNKLAKYTSIPQLSILENELLNPLNPRILIFSTFKCE